MNKKQYIFLILLSLLLYLIFNIIKFEYDRYQMSNYINKQLEVLEKLKEDNKKGQEKIIYVSTLAYQTKKLKAEDNKKLKGEKIIYLTDEKLYNKFKSLKTKKIKKETIKKEEQNALTYGMTNVEKWIYFIFNEDIR